MGWKNLPSWLKGGIIIIIIIILLFSIAFALDKISPSKVGQFGKLSRSTFILFIIILPGAIIMGGNILDGTTTAIIILALFLSGIIYFIIGSLIGLIISKLKSKK